MNTTQQVQPTQEVQSFKKVFLGSHESPVSLAAVISDQGGIVQNDARWLISPEKFRMSKTKMVNTVVVPLHQLGLPAGALGVADVELVGEINARAAKLGLEPCHAECALQILRQHVSFRAFNDVQPAKRYYVSASVEQVNAWNSHLFCVEIGGLEASLSTADIGFYGYDDPQIAQHEWIFVKS